jgi:hypothetical protein
MRVKLSRALTWLGVALAVALMVAHAVYLVV